MPRLWGCYAVHAVPKAPKSMYKYALGGLLNLITPQILVSSRHDIC